MFYRISNSIRRFLARIGEGLSRIGAAMTWPVERLFAATFGRLFRAAEGLDRAEDLLLGLLRLITWPFRAVWAACVWVGALLLPRSVRNFIGSVGSRLGGGARATGAGLVALAERLNLDGLVRRLVWLLQPVWRPLAAIVGFIYVWAATRPYRQMLWALPALALLLPLGATAAWAVIWGRSSVASNYRIAVDEAREAGDYKRMELFESKLAQLGVDTKHTDFQTAQALAQSGKMDEAYERMQRLAPTDHPGFAQAHLWIIQRLLTGELKKSPEDTHQLLGAHLDQLEASGIKAPEIKLLRAAWLAESGDLAQAVKILEEPTVENRSEAALQRMSLHLMLRNLDKARSDARAVRAHFENRRREDAKFTAEEYRWWTVAEGLVGDNRSQAEVVDAWQRDFPEDKFVKEALAERARREVDEQLQAAQPNAQQLAKQIARAVELGGDTARLQQQIGAIYQARNRSPVARAAIDELTKAPDTPEIVLQVLGTYAVVSGEAAEASVLLKRAVEKEPKDPIAWNNYACSLLELPNGNVQEALTAVENALVLAPDTPQFHETRGQVFVRLKQWDKAVEDLELAINGMPNSKTIHRSLADAYTALGQADLANIHREQSQ